MATTRTAAATPDRKVVCRYVRRDGYPCTAEAIDPTAEILICSKHAAKVIDLVNGRLAAAGLETSGPRRGRKATR